jgi:pimeloyl-ACP methyl ester carboxylesterase
VVALDARGHGDSERRPADLSPEACAAVMVRMLRETVRRSFWAEAGHDLHLDRPAEWRAALAEFLG